MSPSRRPTRAGVAALLAGLALLAAACSSGGDASAPASGTDTPVGTSGPPAGTVEAGGYTLTPIDASEVGIEAQVRSPEVQAIADDVSLAVVSQGGRNVGLALRIVLTPDLRGRPEVVDRFAAAAAGGAPVERTEVAGRPAVVYTAGAVEPRRAQLALATGTGDLLVFIGTDAASVAAVAGAVVPVMDTGDHE